MRAFYIFTILTCLHFGWRCFIMYVIYALALMLMFSSRINLLVRTYSIGYNLAMINIWLG